MKFTVRSVNVVQGSHDVLGPQFSALPPVRVVFSITMEGSARKVITVRSALMVKNRLDVPMEVRLDSPSAPDSKTRLRRYAENPNPF